MVTEVKNVTKDFIHSWDFHLSGMVGDSVITEGRNHNWSSYRVSDGDGLIGLTIFVSVNTVVGQILQKIRRVDIGRGGQSDSQNDGHYDLLLNDKKKRPLRRKL